MAVDIIIESIQIRRDTAANWTARNPVLLEGELGLELDTYLMKYGDGVTEWNSLLYFGTTSSANAVNINDIGGFFTGTNVEAALQELGQDVSVLTWDPSGFSGNLAPSDDTLQEVFNKVDALVGGGGGGNTIYSADDSLAGARTVTMGANQLTWSGTGGDIIMNSGRLGVGEQVFGGSRLGDNVLQATAIDTTSLNIKDAGQLTALAVFSSAVGGSDGYTTTMKNFVDDVHVLSINGLGTGTVYNSASREVEATVGLRNDFSGGEFRVFDTFNNDYDSPSIIAEAQGWVAIHGGGATAKEIGLWRYDTTTYSPVFTVDTSNDVTFSGDVTANSFTGSGSSLTDLSAANTTITDAGGFYTATNVEGALQELGGGSGINNVVEDITPQLGGDLDLNNNDIVGTGTINYEQPNPSTFGFTFGYNGGAPQVLLSGDPGYYNIFQNQVTFNGTVLFGALDDGATTQSLVINPSGVLGTVPFNSGSGDVSLEIDNRFTAEFRVTDDNDNGTSLVLNNTGNSVLAGSTQVGLASGSVALAITPAGATLTGGDLTANITYDNATSGLVANDVKSALDELKGQVDAVSGGYVPAANNSLNGSSNFTVTNANRSAAGQIINVLSASENIEIELVSANASEIDKYQFNVDNALGGLTFTSPGGFVVDGISAGQAVRLGGIGAVDFEETAPNSGSFRVYAGTNVSFINIPTVVSATIENADPDALVVVFSEPVNSLTSTGLSLDGDLSDAVISPVSGSGSNTVTYSMSRPAVTGETGNFVYGATNEITDANGYVSLASGSTAVTNNVSASLYSPNNIYTEASALNADNQSLTLGNWSINNGQTATAVVDAGGSAGGGANAIRVQATGPTGGNFLQLALDLAALGLDGDGPINNGSDYDVKFDMKVVTMPATQNAISLEITGAGSGGFTGIAYGSDGQSTYTNYSHTFTGDGSQTLIRLYLGDPSTDATGTYDVYFKNFEIVPTGL